MLLVTFIMAAHCHYNFFADFIARPPTQIILEPLNVQERRIFQSSSLFQLQVSKQVEKSSHFNPTLLKIVKECMILPKEDCGHISPLIQELRDATDDNSINKIFENIHSKVARWMLLNCHKEVLPEHSFLFGVSQEYGSWQNYYTKFNQCKSLANAQEINPYALYALSTVLKVNFVCFSVLSYNMAFISGFLEPAAHALTAEGRQLPMCPIGCIFSGTGKELMIVPLELVPGVNSSERVSEEDKCVMNDDELIIPNVFYNSLQLSGEIEKNAEETEELVAVEDDTSKYLSESDVMHLCQWEPFKQIIGQGSEFEKKMRYYPVSEIASAQLVLRAIAQELSSSTDQKYIFTSRRKYLNKRRNIAQLSIDCEGAQISQRIATKLNLSEIKRRLSSSCRQNCDCLSVFEEFDVSEVAERVQLWRKKYYLLPSSDRFLLLVRYMVELMFGITSDIHYRGVPSNMRDSQSGNICDLQKESVINFFSLSSIFNRIDSKTESETPLLPPSLDGSIMQLPKIKKFCLWGFNFCQEAFRLLTGISGDLMQKARNFIKDRNRNVYTVSDDLRYLQANPNSKYVQAKAWFTLYIKSHAEQSPSDNLLFLPYALKESIYSEMRSHFESTGLEPRQIPSLTTFKEMWICEFSHVRVRQSTPFNKCPVCQYYRSQILFCASSDQVLKNMIFEL